MSTVVQPIRLVSQPVLHAVPPWEMYIRPAAKIVDSLSCEMKAFAPTADRKYSTGTKILDSFITMVCLLKILVNSIIGKTNNRFERAAKL